jgi:hypothetical protein
VGDYGPERDLDAALGALIEAALRRTADAGDAAPAEQARLLAKSLAVGLRELVRAPLREALQAGYELGWRAALEAQRQGVAASPRAVPHSPPPDDASRAKPTEHEPLPSSVPAAALSDARPVPHQVRVDVSPLPNFSAVNRFHAAVASITNVGDTTMVAFRDGRLTLRVDHPDGRALVEAIQALGLGPLSVLAATPDRVDLALDSRQPSVVGRGRGRDAGHRTTARGGRPSAER